MTLNDFTQNDIIMMVDERRVSEMVESIYDDLCFINPDGTLGWDQEPGKYTVVIYMKEGTNAKGEPIDEMYYDIGGYTFIDVEGNVKYFSLEKIANKELSSEDIGLFSDEVLDYIDEGYTTFIADEYGNIEAGSNFKEVKVLFQSAMVQETAVPE